MIIAKGGSPLPTKPSVIPGSDCAAKVILTGSSTSKFKPGDRVSPNFALDHIYGAPTEATKASGLSGEVDGVLGEYRVFPEHVSRFWIHIIRSYSKSSRGERTDRAPISQLTSSFFFLIGNC